ncbi:MAG: diacylglycerol kinase family lipid kinase, partial [Actinomycetes bacterium]
KTFCCIASCGFDSDTNRMANEATGNSSLVYFGAALKALKAWTPAKFTVSVDGNERSFTGFSVVVANSKAYGGGMLIAPDADPTDGTLDVVTIGASSKLSFLMRLPSVFRGTHVKSPAVTVARGKRVEVSADRPFTVFADGDPLCELPAVIEVLQGAVRVLFPE